MRVFVKRGVSILIILMFLLELNLFVFSATPNGVTDVQRISSSRKPASSVKGINAQAGNITELFINATVVTKTWQGYYGDISGQIILDNSNNQSMYNWNVTSPEGEIYAVNETVDSWSDVKCFNFSANPPEENLTTLESELGLTTSSADGVDETFTSTSHPEFYVGSVRINADSCPSTQTYVNDGASHNFYEVLLIEPIQNLVIYTTLINASQTGFDGGTHDFQMLVGVDGHLSSSGKGTYYFYIELQ